MGRNAKFDRESIVSATLELVAEGGPRAATIAAIAERLGAPTGSIYHRYSSRDLILAELWMSVVESFQDGAAEAMQGKDTLQAGVRTALYMPRWVRAHMSQARLLLLHRREDFASGQWPAPLVRRARALRQQMTRALQVYCRRHFGSVARASLVQARFALLDVPYGAVKSYVQAAQPPPLQVDELVELVASAVLTRKQRRG